MAKRENQELSDEAIGRITRVVRSLADDRVERGVDLSRPMHCDSCVLEKPSAGAAAYSEYKLCNDCLLDFTLALAMGGIDNVTDFMTRRSDDDSGPPPPGSLSAERSRPPLSVKSLQGRDKLMPSNEPC